MSDPIVEQPKPPVTPEAPIISAIKPIPIVEPKPTFEPNPTPEPLMTPVPTPKIEQPLQPPIDTEKVATQAKIDSLKAERDLKIKGTLGDSTLPDRREIERIDTELASLDASAKTLPSYLGSPPGWDTDHNTNAYGALNPNKAAVVETPPPPAPSITPEIPVIPVSDNAPKSQGLLSRLFGGLFSSPQKPPQTEIPQAVAKPTPQAPVASDTEETQAA